MIQSEKKRKNQVFHAPIHRTKWVTVVYGRLFMSLFTVHFARPVVKRETTYDLMDLLLIYDVTAAANFLSCSFYFSRSAEDHLKHLPGTRLKQSHWIQICSLSYSVQLLCSLSLSFYFSLSLSLFSSLYLVPCSPLLSEFSCIHKTFGLPFVSSFNQRKKSRRKESNAPWTGRQQWWWWSRRSSRPNCLFLFFLSLSLSLFPLPVVGQKESEKRQHLKCKRGRSKCEWSEPLVLMSFVYKGLTTAINRNLPTDQGRSESQRKREREREKERERSRKKRKDGCVGWIALVGN